MSVSRTAATVVVAFVLGGCSTISTWAGTPDQAGYTGDGGPAIEAKFHGPHGLVFDSQGNGYVTDTGNHAVRKVTPNGVITTIAGGNGVGYSGDGGPATAAKLHFPVSLAFDSTGRLYIADRDNYAVRRVGLNGVITTIAGGNGQGDTGDGGRAVNAQLMWARSVDLDAAGNLYIADRWSSVRKVTPGGIITTFAGGNGLGYSGDGGRAVNAQLYRPRWAAVDARGNVFIADYSNHAIRKVTPAGIISTVAGGNGPGHSGDGGRAIAAQLNHPSSITFDKNNNLVFSEHEGQCVRLVRGGNITTIVGGNGRGFSGDGGPPTKAQIERPSGVAYDPDWNLYVGDRENDVIRKVTPNN